MTKPHDGIMGLMMTPSGADKLFQFFHHLEVLIGEKPGWEVDAMSDPAVFGMVVGFRCHHNKYWNRHISAMDVNAIGPHDLAVFIAAQVMKECGWWHIFYPTAQPTLNPWKSFEDMSAGPGSSLPFSLTPAEKDGDSAKSMFHAVMRAFPSLNTKRARCPALPCNMAINKNGLRSISSSIMHLNDYHRWSREQIADWLDTLEGVDLTIKTKKGTSDAVDNDETTVSTN